MQGEEKRKPNVFAVLVLVLVAVAAVVVVGVLAGGGLTRVQGEQRGAGASAPTATVPPVVEAPAGQGASGQSAVARGGSRNRATATVDTADAGGSEVKLPGETAAAPAVGSVTSGPFRIDIASAIYDVSGKPSQGCAVFDNRVPARRFTLSFSVINDAEGDLGAGDWGAAAFVGAKRATLCLAGGAGLPALPKGQSIPVTLVAFVEPDEAVTQLSINGVNGASARICFNEEKVVACPAG